MEELITKTINGNVNFSWEPTKDNIEKIKKHLDSIQKKKNIPEGKIKQIINEKNKKNKWPKSPPTKNGGGKNKKKLKNKKYKKTKRKKKINKKNKTKRKLKLKF
tara:strand:+ start:283 stop:594 length:312 start_codon:yes stop_codon:yes gene_type:complete